MKKALTSMIAAAAIAIIASVPTKAEAHSHGWWIPGAIVGGLALGAIATGGYYGPGPYYYGGPRYYYRPYGYYRPHRYYRTYRYHRPYRYYR